MYDDIKVLRLKELLPQLENKDTLALSDYVLLREALEQVSVDLAETLRNDIWQYNKSDPGKQGKWHGVGLGYIPAAEIINHVKDMVGIG